jgi:hypothetical protein
MIELCFPGADDLRLSKKEAVGGCRVCLRSKFTPTAALSEPPCHEACEPRTCARFGVFIRGGLIAFPPASECFFIAHQHAGGGAS